MQIVFNTLVKLEQRPDTALFDFLPAEGPLSYGFSFICAVPHFLELLPEQVKRH
jgi:hypothetical protein